jgi:hypothetical protein
MLSRHTGCGIRSTHSSCGTVRCSAVGCRDGGQGGCGWWRGEGLERGGGAVLVWLAWDGADGGREDGEDVAGGEEPAHGVE